MSKCTVKFHKNYLKINFSVTKIWFCTHLHNDSRSTSNAFPHGIKRTSKNVTVFELLAEKCLKTIENQCSRRCYHYKANELKLLKIFYINFKRYGNFVWKFRIHDIHRFSYIQRQRASWPGRVGPVRALKTFIANATFWKEFEASKVWS